MDIHENYSNIFLLLKGLYGFSFRILMFDLFFLIFTYNHD